MSIMMCRQFEIFTVKLLLFCVECIVIRQVYKYEDNIWSSPFSMIAKSGKVIDMIKKRIKCRVGVEVILVTY